MISSIERHTKDRSLTRVEIVILYSQWTSKMNSKTDWKILNLQELNQEDPIEVIKCVWLRGSITSTSSQDKKLNMMMSLFSLHLPFLMDQLVKELETILELSADFLELEVCLVLLDQVV